MKFFPAYSNWLTISPIGFQAGLLLFVLILWVILCILRPGSASFFGTLRVVKWPVLKKREMDEKARSLELYHTILDSLSHELRTPIASILCATDNLLERPNRLSADDSRKMLTEIALASLRLNRQVDNLLNISRLESGHIQPKKDWCDVQELLSNLVNNLREQLACHQVEINVTESLPLVQMDYGLMEQAIANLVYNASLYTPEGSTIRIGACFPKTLKSRPTMKASGSLLIFVEDNGPGFPENEINRVFEKFYQLHNSGNRGTGLGLSIAKGFVEAQGGTLTLNNRFDMEAGIKRRKGARFEIRLATETFHLKQRDHEYGGNLSHR